MTITARIAVLPQHSREIHIETLELPNPGPHQVSVKLIASGVCHSQLHEIQAPRENPVVLGHEATGTVLATGNEVTHVQAGDTVMVTWVVRDSANTPRQPGNVAVQVSDGIARAKEVYTWADHTQVDEQFVVKMNPNAATDVTSIIGCAVMTGAGAVINTVDVQPGQSVVVIGAGGVGLSAIAAASVAGANPIIAVDLDEKKLEFARNFGATDTVNASNDNPVKAIRVLTTLDSGYTYMGAPISGADYVFDCIGHAITMKQAVAACRRGAFGASQGGTAVFVGLPTEKLELSPMDILVSEKTVRGSYCGSCVPETDVPRFLEWHATGKLDLNALVTSRYKLQDINKAVADLQAGKIFGRAIIEY